MVRGIQKCSHNHSNKSFALSPVMILFFHATNIAILENLSMTTNTHSLPCLVEGGKQIVHGHGFPQLAQVRKRSVQALFLDGWFGIGVGSEESDIFPNI